MDNLKTGKYIQKLRQEKNLTQNDLAKKLFISDKAISKWERGLCAPDISLLEKLAEILDTSVIELLRGERLNNNSINKKDALNTINDIKEITTKSNIKKIDKIFMCLLIILILYILLLFINPIKYQKYKLCFENIKSNEIANFENNSKIILNNRGKFNQSEYRKITNWINSIYTVRNIEYDKNIMKKQCLSFDEIYELIYTNNTIPVDENINNLLGKYKIQNINYDPYDKEIFEQYIYSIYINKNPKNITFDASNTMKDYIIYIDNLYKNFNTILKELMKAGEIYE